jgi:hypothetical protein
VGGLREDGFPEALRTFCGQALLSNPALTPVHSFIHSTEVYRVATMPGPILGTRDS